MNYDKQIYWRQGLFLRPQHFQLQDLFHHAELNYRWQVSQPNGWGIKLLRISDSALNAELFEILECELLTRDGWLLKLGAELREPSCSVEPRSFKGLFDPGKGALSVYLAFPRRPHGQEGSPAKQPAADGDGGNGGLAASPLSVPDLFDVTLEPVEIDLVMRQARILFDQEPGFEALKAAFDLIKVGELVRTGQSRAVSRSATYVYPCLTIGSSDVLLRRLKELRDTLVGKIDEFVSVKRQRGVRATATSVQEAIRVQQLQTMTRRLPALEHLLEARAMHPQAAYGVLREFVGELSAFSESFSALGAQIVVGKWGTICRPTITKIWPRFQLVLERIVTMLNELTVGAEAGIKLEYDGVEYYRAALSDEFFEGEHTRYYLMIDTLISPEQLLNKLGTGKLTTYEDMDRLRASFLFGLDLKHLLVPPEELPQKGGYSYFAVNTQDNTWKQIKTRKNIALLADLDPKATTIRLLPVRRDHE